MTSHCWVPPRSVQRQDRGAYFRGAPGVVIGASTRITRAEIESQPGLHATSLQDAEELGNPADIAAEIVADLRKAIAAFEEVAAELTKPAPITAPGTVEAT
ncbi:hypothetical protein SAZ11_60865 [Streptomyces sp. FXJ1.4098]|nr:hypothetical protein [Streptomyces sp. FXJ1.4098]